MIAKLICWWYGHLRRVSVGIPHIKYKAKDSLHTYPGLYQDSHCPRCKGDQVTRKVRAGKRAGTKSTEGVTK